MQATIKEIAQAFSGHRFEETYEYLADDVMWVNVGGETYESKAAVMAACNTALEYFATIESTIEKLEALEGQGESFVVVESRGSYTDKDETSVVEACDIYVFESGKVTGITSYNIEITD